MRDIDTVVFLAAGMGNRLKNINHGLPKGFLEIGGVSLIEQSVRKLINAGIKNIFIGTGYMSEVYENFAIGYGATCIKNNIFSETGSMYTLYNMRNHIKSSFLLLEADLLYDQSGITQLLDDDHADTILASGKTGSGDEVYIETDPDSNLVCLSKDPSLLASIDAELVGISKVSLSTFQLMCVYAGEQFSSNPKLDYEYSFVGISDKHKIFIKKIEDFIWCEIDDQRQYQRAIEKIYPLIS